MVKVDLITGFLGSGKTTFLLSYARYLMKQGERIGILEYDYGAVNVDMLLLGQLRGPKCELEMLAAACDEDCLRRRFKTKLIAMAMSGYDRVIIEPSGIFDMDQFYDTLRDEPLENWYEIGNVITIVNAQADDEENEAEFWLASQCACAGCIVFSRTQLVDDSKLKLTEEYIEAAVERIRCRRFGRNYIEKDWSEFTDEDYAMIAGSGYHIGDYVKTIAGTESLFDSVSSLKVKDNLDGIRHKIDIMFNDSVYGDIYRVKGFVVDKGGSFQVNATRKAVMIEPVSIGQGTVIVIGMGLNKKMIQELLEE